MTIAERPVSLLQTAERTLGRDVHLMLWRTGLQLKLGSSKTSERKDLAQLMHRHVFKREPDEVEPRQRFEIFERRREGARGIRQEADAFEVLGYLGCGV